MVHALPDLKCAAPTTLSKYVRNAGSWSFFEFTDDIAERWFQYLQRFEAALSGAVLVPCSDDGLEFVAQHRDALTNVGYRPFKANDEAVLDMLDKGRTYEIARKVGVPVPRADPVSSLEALRALAADYQYPCALKPVHSHRFRRHFDVKAFVANSPAELESCYRSIDATGVEMLLTEIVPGVDDEYCSYYSYLDEDGSPLVNLTKRKLRQYPNGFGMGTYHMTKWEPEAAQLGIQFVQSAGLRGLVNVEFKRDARDQQLKLIECNARLTAANEVVRRAGVDFARIAYDRALGRPVAPPATFREGVYEWHPVADYRAFRQYRSHGQLTTVQWLASLMHRQSIPLVALDDLAPVFSRLAGSVRKQGDS
jgi:predicted ATP-grasp superfamily ATP-dependent carboligase